MFLGRWRVFWKLVWKWAWAQAHLSRTILSSGSSLPWSLRSDLWLIVKLWIIVDYYDGLIQPCSTPGIFSAAADFEGRWWWERKASLRYDSEHRGDGYMETRLTCQGRNCHYLRAGRKPETLMAKSITLTTSTSAPAGLTPETGRSHHGVSGDRWPLTLVSGWNAGDQIRGRVQIDLPPKFCI